MITPLFIIRVNSVESGIRNFKRYESIYPETQATLSEVKLRNYWRNTPDPALLYYPALTTLTAWNLTGIRSDSVYNSWPILTETEVQQIFL